MWKTKTEVEKVFEEEKKTAKSWRITQVVNAIVYFLERADSTYMEFTFPQQGNEAKIMGLEY